MKTKQTKIQFLICTSLLQVLHGHMWPVAGILNSTQNISESPAGMLGQRENLWIVALFQWKLSHETFIVSCKISPDGKYVVSGLDVDHGICITDAEDTTTVSHIKGEFVWAPCSILSVVTATCHLTDSDFRLLCLVNLQCYESHH